MSINCSALHHDLYLPPIIHTETCNITHARTHTHTKNKNPKQVLRMFWSPCSVFHCGRPETMATCGGLKHLSCCGVLWHYKKWQVGVGEARRMLIGFLTLYSLSNVWNGRWENWLDIGCTFLSSLSSFQICTWIPSTQISIILSVQNIVTRTLHGSVWSENQSHCKLSGKAQYSTAKEP